jgi:hypothetical protein
VFCCINVLCLSGEWWRLVALLESPYVSTHHKSLVAWCIGTAIKNTDSFQQWMIESPDTSAGGGLHTVDASAAPLHLLLQLLFNSTVDVDEWDKYGESVNTADPEMVNRLETELQNKILYALSSACSNNAPVQVALHQYMYQNNSFISEIVELLQGPVLQELKTVSLERVRKIWNVVLDLVEYSVDAGKFPETVSDISVATIRSAYCSADWGVLLSDHLEMASAGSSTDPAVLKLQEQQLEQECVQTAVLNQGKDASSSEQASPFDEQNPSSGVALVMKKRKNLLSGIQRSLVRLQDSLQSLCHA